MDTFGMRLRLLLLPRTLLLMLLIGGGGFLAISLFAEYQISGFSLDNPSFEPIEVMIKDRLAGRYAAIGSGWVVSTIAFFWTYFGRQLRKAERMM